MVLSMCHAQVYCILCVISQYQEYEEQHSAASRRVRNCINSFLCYLQIPQTFLSADVSIVDLTFKMIFPFSFLLALPIQIIGLGGERHPPHVELNLSDVIPIVSTQQQRRSGKQKKNLRSKDIVNWNRNWYHISLFCQSLIGIKTSVHYCHNTMSSRVELIIAQLHH